MRAEVISGKSLIDLILYGATAILRRADNLAAAGQHSEAISAYDAVIDTFGDCQDLQVMDVVAGARVGKVRVLEICQRN